MKLLLTWCREQPTAGVFFLARMNLDMKLVVGSGHFWWFLMLVAIGSTLVLAIN